MKIIAFMLSPSESVFPAGTDKQIIEHYRDDPAYHRKMLRQSMSGNRLYQAFGEMFDQIEWDNVAPVDGRINQRYVDQKIAEFQPDLILTFGNDANDTVAKSISALRVRVMFCHHPNARYKTQDDLNEFAQTVRNVRREFETKLEFYGDESEIH